MFDNQLFEKWLSDQSMVAMKKITEGDSVTPNEMMVLVLKAQTNHITHMEKDLHTEMITLRKDMDSGFKRVDKEIITLRKDMDKRFEQMDQRFSLLTLRMDSFMKWSFTSNLIIGGLVVTAIQLLK